MEVTGGCVYGGTRYVLKSRPFALVDCHCIDCRRSAGAPYVQWGSVPRRPVNGNLAGKIEVKVQQKIDFAGCAS